VKPIEEFLRAIDRGWKPAGAGRITLQVIGSTALMLRAGYERGTKDSDVLETPDITPEIKKALLDLAGKGSALFRAHRMYVDVVFRALLFLPTRPLFHPVPALDGLKNFRVEALDPVDVAVSKLARFSANDSYDIKAMADLGLIEHGRLLERFRLAMDAFSTDARAEDIPKFVKNLHAVERDHLLAPESEIDLPDWMQDRQ